MHTSVCDLFGIRHPILQAPIGHASNPVLVSAVSEAGGMGLLAGTWTETPRLLEAIREIKRRTDRPFGVNFVLHLADPGKIALCLAEGVPVLSSFRGDPGPTIAQAHAAGALALHQVTTPDEAQAAIRAGVDAVIAQGIEAGGHGGGEPLWSLLPEVCRRAGRLPVLAAGGIVDGRGLAAALALGAAGAVMGTRFLASSESSASPSHKRAVLAAGPDDTLYSEVWDRIWGEDWPGVKVRALRNAALVRWHDRLGDLDRNIAEARADLDRSTREDDPTGFPLLAGMGVGRIESLEPAASILHNAVAEAERVLADLATTTSDVPD